MGFVSVDIGNTAVKTVGFSDNGEILFAVETPSVVEAGAIEDVSLVNDIAYCTTRDLSEAEREIVERGGWWKFHTDRAIPLKLNYRTPGTLGADRVAAALGASVLFPGNNVMVVDIGTALTIDLVSDRGEFIGGNISAGIKMRLKALHHYTSKLPLVEWREVDSAFGYDTETAMICGATYGVVTEICGCHKLASSEYPDLRLVLTGGGITMIEKELMKMAPDNTEIYIIPNLIAFGLKKAYYNDKRN